jgi:hypothetical protein
MPHGDNPDSPGYDAIERSIRAHDDLAIRKLGEFGKGAPRLGKSLQPAQRRFGSSLESPAGGRIVTDDVCDRVQKLLSAGRREADSHPHAPGSR